MSKTKKVDSPKQPASSSSPAAVSLPADIPRMIPNPAWTESEEWSRQKQLTMVAMAVRGECPEDAFPEDYGKDIPEDGAWIMLLMSVVVGKLDHYKRAKIITVPRLSLWYAMPHTSNMRTLLHDLGIKRRRAQEYVYLKQAVVNTPDGAVHIWPREYKKIDITTFLDFCEEDGLFIHYLNDESHIDESALFYLRSRGIAKADAQRMLLGMLRNPNYCYFTFAPELVECFGEGAGTPYLHSVNHQRRAANHARRAANHARRAGYRNDPTEPDPAQKPRSIKHSEGS